MTLHCPTCGKPCDIIADAENPFAFGEDPEAFPVTSCCCCDTFNDAHGNPVPLCDVWEVYNREYEWQFIDRCLPNLLARTSTPDYALGGIK